MSVRLMGEIFGLDLPAVEKLVLLAMADHARDDGTGCYPSVGTLARKTSQSRRGVQKIMRRLEQAGWIAPSKLSKGRRANEYRITLANREPGSLFPPTQPRTTGPSTANHSASNREPGSPEPPGTVSKPAAAAAASHPTPNPEPENSVWTFLGIQPCGPLPFRTRLEAEWANRNGGPYSILIGDALDAWKATEGQNPKGCAALFRALSKLRDKEKTAKKPSAGSSRSTVVNDKDALAMGVIR